MPDSVSDLTDRFIGDYHINLARLRREKPAPLKKKDLYSRVIAAAQAIGISDPVIVKWETDPVPWWTSAAVRERKYALEQDGKNTENERVDLGFFRKDYDTRPRRRDEPIRSEFGNPDIVSEPVFHPTIRSFEINGDPRVFSQKRFEQFMDALRKRGLQPQLYVQPCRPHFYSDAEVRLAEDVRSGKILPLYR